MLYLSPILNFSSFYAQEFSSYASWLLGDFPTTITPSKLYANFKFIIFFILLVIYSEWQNNNKELEA